MKKLKNTDPQQKAAQQWRPIETAPKDGEIVLLFTRGRFMFLGWWNMGIKLWYSGRPLAFDLEQPTHWMPLPAPPKGESDE